MSDRPLCRHCHLHKVNRPKGLCWRCSTTPAICVLYEPIHFAGRRGVGNGHVVAKPPTEPTVAKTGTVEKVDVMVERFARRENLWHSADATWEGVTPEHARETSTWR